MSSTRRVDEWGIILYYNDYGYHRTDGPAIESPDGFKEWRINGVIHREDGPAIIFSDGDVQYYLNNIRYSKEDYELNLLKIKLGKLLEL